MWVLDEQRHIVAFESERNDVTNFSYFSGFLHARLGDPDMRVVTVAKERVHEVKRVLRVYASRVEVQ